jgi:hypothetical protein
MATQSLAKPRAPRAEVVVVIDLDPSGNIVVHPDHFWVHKSDDEEVKWYCSIEHKHGDENHPCFTVDFSKNDSPFSNWHFEGHRTPSGCAIVQPSAAVYKYTVSIPGKVPLDPGGGVKE